MMLKYFGKNKKGSVTDVIFGGAYLLKTAVVILIMIFIWISFQAIMSATVVGSASEGVINNVMDVLTGAYYSIDYLFPLLIGGLLLVSTLFAFKTGANLIYGIISFIVWIISLILSILFVNVYLAVSDAFPTIYTSFPIMDFIMSNLHFFSLGWLIIITLVMFRKSNKEDSSGDIQGRFYG